MNINQFENKSVNGLNLIDLIKIFLKYKKTIISVSLVISLITFVVVFFIVSPIFKSTGVVKISTKSGGISSLLGATSLSGLGDVGELGNMSTSKELALYENILSSRRCIEDVISKFNLNSEWEFKHTQDAIKYFRESVLEIVKDKNAGMLEISIYDKYPQRAKEICDYMIFELNKINSEMNAQNAKNNKEFIESRYNGIKSDLKNAEDSLKIYQDKFGIAPDMQIKAATQTQFTLEAELKTEEVKLDLIKKILSPDESELKLQQEKINAIKKQIDNIRNTNKEESNSMLSIKGGPDIILNYLRLTRNVEIQTKMLLYIMPIFEQAKIEEKRDTPSVIVLDNPNMPEVKSKPKRLTVTALSFILTLFLTYFLILLYKRVYINLIAKIKE